MLSNRKNGILMHISSVPGNTGIGTLGKNSYRFVDFLKETKQTYWQILPVGPTSYGDSPYQSFSTFAGNPYFIDLEILAEEGWLSKEDYESVNWGHPNYIDYGLIYVERHKIFQKLQDNFEKKPCPEFNAFCEENKFWLEDYALFMAVKDAHNGISFDQWEDGIKCRKPESMAEWKEKCARRCAYYKILQFFFYRQWNALKKYANDNGIRIIGDIPIYVAADSADVWSDPSQFSIDQDMKPVEVAGCPPDAFSADGQLWGNPVYNWENMKKTDYQWWKNRIRSCLSLYDVVRIDHFRGFESFYAIPYGRSDAKIGEWKKGPGIDLFNSLKKEFGKMNVIAEDLGFLTEEVKQLLRDSTFPGMKILQFAFDSREASDYIPYKYTANSVVYTGTHDNDTVYGWTSSAPAESVENAKRYLRVDTNEEVVSEMMVQGMASVSNTCILTVQDLLCLGSEARINTPSTVGNNWKWRLGSLEELSKTKEFLTKYTELYGRA